MKPLTAYDVLDALKKISEPGERWCVKLDSQAPGRAQVFSSKRPIVSSSPQSTSFTFTHRKPVEPGVPTLKRHKLVRVEHDEKRPGPACFYCRRKIGEWHAFECVTVERRVRVRLAIEYEIEVPQAWTPEAINFHRNDSSWCANNGIDEVEELRKVNGPGACICGQAEYTYLGEGSKP